jgi:acetyl esterase/lipase
VGDAVSDLAALDWVRTQAGQYAINPRRIVLAGGSAGGMTVLNLVHESGHSLAGVVAVVDLWGTPPKLFRRFETVNPATPPTFIVHGTADQLVDYALSPAFQAELEQAGRRAELLTLPDAPHTPLMHFDAIVAAIGRFLDPILGESLQAR